MAKFLVIVRKREIYNQRNHMLLFQYPWTLKQTRLFLKRKGTQTSLWTPRLLLWWQSEWSGIRGMAAHMRLSQSAKDAMKKAPSIPHCLPLSNREGFYMPAYNWQAHHIMEGFNLDYLPDLNGVRETIPGIFMSSCLFSPLPPLFWWQQKHPQQRWPQLDKTEDASGATSW